MEDSETLLTQDQAFVKAHDVLTDLQQKKNDDNKIKGHALLLAYDPDREAFQMVAINSDADEIRALLLSCLATIRQALDSTTEGRTLN